MSNQSGAHRQRRVRLVPARRRLTGNPGGMLLAAMLVVTSAAAETAGERIASKGASQPGAVACASCHGPDGGGNEQSGFPRLAGLDAAYIESQLRAYQQGQRKNPVMAGMAAPLTDQDIKDVAVYYAALASAVAHHGRRITRFPWGQLAEAFGGLSRRPWVHPELSVLFRTAQRRAAQESLR